MIERYTLEGMGKIWEEENRFSQWLAIEIAACEVLHKEGVIPQKDLRNIKKKVKIDLARIHAIEKINQHEVIAFLDALKEKIGPSARYIHLGLTSSDIMDTGLSLQMKQATEIILKDIEKLKNILRRKAKKYKNTVMIGRTHGIHAQPITFGLKLALWWEEMKRNQERMKRAKEIISYGKISGAVGTYAHTSPRLEKQVCQKLGLRPAPVSTQVLQRDRHAEYLQTLALIAASLEKFALEIRHLQRTEVREVEEPFTKGQKGSSAMPHKRNPIFCERICGLSRVIRANAQVGLENIALWHERDISHSSTERVIIADSSILTDYILEKFIFILDNLVVYPDKMKENLDLTKGLIFSQSLLIQLIEKGIGRKKAYELVQKNALRCYDKGENFKSLILKDKDIAKCLGKKEIEKCFDLSPLLGKVEEIFDRIRI